jgi:hypothetical protein
MFHYQKSALERKPVVGGDRFKWEAAVLACPDLSDAEARVLARLALHMNLNIGRLNVGVETLAKGANQKPRKATETITKAEKLGFLERTIGGGRKNTNSYRLFLIPETLHGDAGFGPETLHAHAETPARPGKKPCPHGHPNIRTRRTGIRRRQRSLRPFNISPRSCANAMHSEQHRKCWTA